jgi:CDP-diacylglycerol--serine O-phosphatidyltransferase
MKMFNIPNLFTAGNMLCGVFAIILAFAGRIDIAPYFIFLAAVLDFFDGFLARILKQQGELGKQLDSLADMISFGLAPGIIMMVILIVQTVSLTGFEELFNVGEYISVNWAVEYSGSGVSESHLALSIWFDRLAEGKIESWLPFTALIVPFFSLFRLAKFNIDTRQSESFIGLPTPANTIFFMAFPLLLANYGNATGWEHDLILWMVQPMVLIPIIVVMSIMLVSELPLFALKFKTFKWQGNEIRYIFLISCGILITNSNYYNFVPEIIIH